MDQGLQITVGADVKQLVGAAQTSTESIKSLEKELELLGTAIDHTFERGADTSKLEDAYQELKDKITSLRQTASQPITIPPVPPIPVPDDTAFLNTIQK